MASLYTVSCRRYHVCFKCSFFSTRLFSANNVKLMPLNTMDWDQTICTFTVLHQVCCCLIGSALFLPHFTSSDIMPAKWPGFHSAQRLRQKKTMEITRTHFSMHFQLHFINSMRFQFNYVRN